MIRTVQAWERDETGARARHRITTPQLYNFGREIWWVGPTWKPVWIGEDERFGPDLRVTGRVDLLRRQHQIARVDGWRWITWAMWRMLAWGEDRMWTTIHWMLNRGWLDGSRLEQGRAYRPWEMVLKSLRLPRRG
ncbi:MAG TPA: hypothetical protein VGQ24_09695 [Gemmatimonadales bacterium]|jgi:hypothetical protein|nr:hypothetical protein [Gemmatimonadales bacterium]